jgi:NAD(P)-dependent dehydrogenase (short-subunit alcohol dehydrogenase family)
MNLNGQVAGVTGGDRNFGLQSAFALGEAGARPVITDIDDAAGQQAVAQLAERQIQAEYLAMDVTDSAQVNAVADRKVASLVSGCPPTSLR